MFGAPYVPTHRKQALLALDVAEVGPGDKFYELGCGDGKVLLLAEERGARVIGYELNPLLFMLCKLRTWRRPNIKVIYGNFWQKNLTGADVVFVFLLDRYMRRLDKKLTKELKPGARLISYVFKIPDRKASFNRQGVHLYKY